MLKLKKEASFLNTLRKSIKAIKDWNLDTFDLNLCDFGKVELLEKEEDIQRLFMKKKGKIQLFIEITNEKQREKKQGSNNTSKKDGDSTKQSNVTNYTKQSQIHNLFESDDPIVKSDIGDKTNNKIERHSFENKKLRSEADHDNSYMLDQCFNNAIRKTQEICRNLDNSIEFEPTIPKDIAIIEKEETTYKQRILQEDEFLRPNMVETVQHSILHYDDSKDHDQKEIKMMLSQVLESQKKIIDGFTNYEKNYVKKEHFIDVLNEFKNIAQIGKTIEKVTYKITTLSNLVQKTNSLNKTDSKIDKLKELLVKSKGKCNCQLNLSNLSSCIDQINNQNASALSVVENDINSLKTNLDHVEKKIKVNMKSIYSKTKDLCLGINVAVDDQLELVKKHSPRKSRRSMY